MQLAWRRVSRAVAVVAVSLLGCLGAGRAAAAATFEVLHLSDSGPGSLRQAVLDANATPGADTVVFQAGLTGTMTLTSGQILITDSLDILGPGAGALTVSGNDASRIFRVQSPTSSVVASLSGLTLTHGSERFGGAVGVFGGILTVRDSVISDSTALFAGGNVYVETGSLNVETSTISGGQADEGGGIAINEGLLVIVRSTLSGNTAEEGGALHASNATVQIQSSTISGNTATSNGGGGFGDSSSTFELRLTTVSDNSAGVTGGSFFLQVPGLLELDHSILANGTPQDLSGDGTVVASWSLIEAPGSATLLGRNNLLGIDPLLAPLADNGGPTRTHALLPGSPAIGAGDPAIPSPPPTDQRGPGFARIVGLRIDLGSYELQELQVADIPSLSEMGLLALATLLAGVGVLVLRR